MGLFGQLFHHKHAGDESLLLPAIERAVTTVEPLLRQAGGYPGHYRKPVTAALEYVHQLAAELPDPIAVDRETYASDAYVHALFPDINAISESICASLAVQNYLRDFPASEEFYGLMGMRRFEKTVAGMEVVGQVVQHDVLQKVVYFSGHTIDHTAPSEQQAREQIALSMFDSLANKVKTRVEQRKKTKQELLLQKDMLVARLHNASDAEKPALEEKLADLIRELQTTVSSLEPGKFVEDFEAVMLRPQDHLYLKQKQITLDSMGIQRDPDGAGSAREILFNDLIGYDRRDWTVTMVRCGNLQRESFASKLDKAYRKLMI